MKPVGKPPARTEENRMQVQLEDRQICGCSVALELRRVRNKHSKCRWNLAGSLSLSLQTDFIGWRGRTWSCGQILGAGLSRYAAAVSMNKGEHLAARKEREPKTLF